MRAKETTGLKIIRQWLAAKEFKAFAFQEETWEQLVQHKSGLVNAPTGFGKTFSVFLGSLIQFINDHPSDYRQQHKNGLQLLWVTPLRALAKDIGRAMEEVIAELGMQWQVATRNGDTSISDRQKQKRNMPEVLIITPESLHLLLAQKGYPELFKKLRIIAVDEWHELIGSKRGILVELALSRIIAVCKQNKQAHPLCVWGISATIGNLEQARDVLLASLQTDARQQVIVKADLEKRIDIESVLPDEIENYPWAGHLGLKLAEKIVPIIEQSITTLLFINTRGMSELWYQKLLVIAPQFAGAIALHHGSIEHELRIWVEEALHTKKLKVILIFWENCSQKNCNRFRTGSSKKYILFLFPLWCYD